MMASPAAADAKPVGTVKSNATDLQRSVLTQADPPDGYESSYRKGSSKPTGCIQLDVIDADRAYVGSTVAPHADVAHRERRLRMTLI